MKSKKKIKVKKKKLVIKKHDDMASPIIHMQIEGGWEGEKERERVREKKREIETDRKTISGRDRKRLTKRMSNTK